MDNEPAERQAADVVAGIFKDEDAASRAIEDLVEAHFDVLRDVSVIVAHRREHEGVLVMEEPAVGRGSEVGAGIGATLGVLGVSLVATGLVSGPVGLLAAGPILAVLQGAFGGGAAGWLVGALAGLGFWEDEADFHRAHIHEGAIWVGVHATADRAELAKEIMRGAGARHFQG